MPAFSWHAAEASKTSRDWNLTPLSRGHVLILTEQTPQTPTFLSHHHGLFNYVLKALMNIKLGLLGERSLS